MPDGIGLSIGATAMAAVLVGRAAVRRTPVLTLFGHRPPELGVPDENPRLDEPGLVIADFVDRVGDPVAILAPDGTSHRGEVLTADALRAALYTLTRGREPVDPITVTHPAHWHDGAVEALRSALADVREFGRSTPVLPDAAATLTALRDDPGLPTRGVIALCDFGGSGTSITLADADGLQPLAPTVRHLDLSGDAIDQALLTHVVSGLSAAGAVDVSGTSAIGSLTRLRRACRGAKERLSTETVTALTVELPGHSGEIRLTRAELDDVVRQPLGDLVTVLRSSLERAGVRQADLVAVATAGGGARIPIVTTTLSEGFRVPVVTGRQPELAAAIGAGLAAARGADDDRTALTAAAPATAAAPVVEDAAQSGTLGALAWSDADDIPDIAPAAYEPDPQVRPQFLFGPPESGDDRRPAAVPWYRRPPVALGIGAAAVLAALAAAVLLVNRDDDAPATTDTTATTTATTTEAPAPAAPPPADTPAPQAPAPETRTFTQTAPPPAATEAPPPPPPATEAPPPPPEEPPAPPPPTTTPPAEPPPATTTPPRLIPTLPYTTIPGLPFVPAPPGFGG